MSMKIELYNIYLLICPFGLPPLKLIDILDPPKLNILLLFPGLLFILIFLLLLFIYILLFLPFWILHTFWEFCPTSILLLDPLNTTLDKMQFLCEAFILLYEPLIIKFNISLWNIILLLLPEIVSELIEPLTIKVELFLLYV